MGKMSPYSRTNTDVILQVRKWKTLSGRHGKSKDGGDGPDGPSCGATPPFVASPIVLECAVCSGPYIGYVLDDAWQPRQRTQASCSTLLPFGNVREEESQ